MGIGIMVAELGAQLVGGITAEIVAKAVLPAAKTVVGKIAQGVAVGCVGMGVGYGASKAVEDMAKTVVAVNAAWKDTMKNIKEKMQKESEVTVEVEA